MTQKARDWDELERMAGIQHNVPRAVTQRDVEALTAKRLSVSKTWRRKLRRGTIPWQQP